MNKQDVTKLQTCVLKVNVHCEGCKHKVKKQLQKIEGVDSVKADVEQGKVTVTGNVDPAILIKKLSKSGKHSEIMVGGGGGGGRGFPNLNAQFGNLSMNGNGKAQGGKDSNQGKGKLVGGGGRGYCQGQPMQVPPAMKEQKSVKFADDDEFSEDDYDDDEDDDDEVGHGHGQGGHGHGQGGHGHQMPPNKMMMMPNKMQPMGQRGPKRPSDRMTIMNGLSKGGGGGGGGGKKGGGDGGFEIPVQKKGIGEGKMGKEGNSPAESAVFFSNVRDSEKPWVSLEQTQCREHFDSLMQSHVRLLRDSVEFFGLAESRFQESALRAEIEKLRKEFDELYQDREAWKMKAEKEEVRGLDEAAEMRALQDEYDAWMRGWKTDQAVINLSKKKLSREIKELNEEIRIKDLRRLAEVKRLDTDYRHLISSIKEKWDRRQEDWAADCNHREAESCLALLEKFKVGHFAVPGALETEMARMERLKEESKARYSGAGDLVLSELAFPILPGSDPVGVSGAKAAERGSGVTIGFSTVGGTSAVTRTD